MRQQYMPEETERRDYWRTIFGYSYLYPKMVYISRGAGCCMMWEYFQAGWFFWYDLVSQIIGFLSQMQTFHQPHLYKRRVRYAQTAYCPVERSQHPGRKNPRRYTLFPLQGGCCEQGLVRQGCFYRDQIFVKSQDNMVHSVFWQEFLSREGCSQLSFAFNQFLIG